MKDNSCDWISAFPNTFYLYLMLVPSLQFYYLLEIPWPLSYNLWDELEWLKLLQIQIVHIELILISVSYWVFLFVQ